MNRKKGLSLILQGCLVAGMLAGCGGSDTKENGGNAVDTAENKKMETINIHLPKSVSFTDEGIKAVEDEMNKIMAEKYGVQIDLNFIDLGNWVTQSNMALTTDECDVIALGNSPLYTFVNNGQLEPLTKYYADATDEMKAQFTEEKLQATTFNGELYSLSNAVWFGNGSAAFMNRRIMDEMQIDPESIDSIEKFDELLYQVHEKYPDIYPMVPGVAVGKLLDTWYFGDGIGDADGKYGVVPIFDEDFDENNMKVEPLFATDGFREIAEYVYKWYQDGLVLPDVVSNTIDGRTYIQNDQAFAFICRQGGLGYKEVVTTEVEPWYVSPALKGSACYSSTLNAWSYGISSNSKHKDEAWTVLQALFSDKEVATLFIEGIKDKDYVVTENNVADFPEGIDMSNSAYGGVYQSWLTTNPLICDVTPAPLGLNLKETSKAFNESLLYSPLVGFSWDSSECTDEMTAVANVYDEYYKALMSGLIDPEVGIPEALEALEAAGIDKILDSQQKQLDEFVKNKK